MPEEPDLSPEDIEILDQNIRKRIEAKKQLRGDRNQIHRRPHPGSLAVAPDGMEWQEIRQMFAEAHSDEQVRQALQKLMKTPLPRNKVEKMRQHSGERFLLAAS